MIPEIEYILSLTQEDSEECLQTLAKKLAELNSKDSKHYVMVCQMWLSSLTDYKVSHNLTEEQIIRLGQLALLFN